MSDPKGTTINADAATGAMRTAGHWDYDEGDLSIYMMDDGGSPVLLFQPHDLCDGDVIPWAEMVAKTQLAACAPALLDALKSALMALQLEGVCGSECVSCNGARALIATATGAA